MAQTQRIDIKGYDAVVKELGVIKRSQLPVAISQSLNELGALLREEEMKVIGETFTNLVPFTRKAPVYRQSKPENLSLRFLLRDRAGKGTAPDTYLYPQVEGGPVYVTNFNKQLQKMKGMEPGWYGAYWMGDKKLRGGKLNQILFGLSAKGPTIKSQGPAPLSATKRFVVIPRMKGGEKVTNGVVAALYERKGRQLERLFSIFDKPIEVKPKYQWNERRIGGFADQKFVGLLTAALDRL